MVKLFSSDFKLAIEQVVALTEHLLDISHLASDPEIRLEFLIVNHLVDYLKNKHTTFVGKAFFRKTAADR